MPGFPRSTPLGPWALANKFSSSVLTTKTTFDHRVTVDDMAIDSRVATSSMLVGLAVVMSILVGAPASVAVTDSRANAAAGQSTQLTWSATVDGRRVADVDIRDPVALPRGGPSVLTLNLTNHGPKALAVVSVRLEGRAMTMTVFRYTIRLNMVLAPRASTERRIALDVDDVGGQAIGLIPAHLQLIGRGQRPLVEEDFPVLVKGSLASAYGVVGLAFVGITAVLAAEFLWAMLQGRLPTSRWLRGLRLLWVGAFLGLSLSFLLAVTRQLTPTDQVWLSLMLVLGGLAFMVGYGASFEPAEDERDWMEPDELEPPNTILKTDMAQSKAPTASGTTP